VQTPKRLACGLFQRSASFSSRQTGVTGESGRGMLAWGQAWEVQMRSVRDSGRLSWKVLVAVSFLLLLATGVAVAGMTEARKQGVITLAEEMCSADGVTPVSTHDGRRYACND
jgi:hypothetical protein